MNKNLKIAIKEKTFCLSNHPMFNHNPERLMNIGLDRAKNLAKRRFGVDGVPVEIMVSIYKNCYTKIQFLEHKIKEQLEKIAEETIREMYNVPEEIDILPRIVDQDDIDYEHESQNKEVELSLDRLEIIQEEANKRIILNSIAHGSSVLIWTNVYYIAKEKLDKLNKKLIKEYDEYSAIVGLILWMQEPENNMDDTVKQGICKVNFDEGLNCEGINFPVLLMETNKVVIDYLICKGIPIEFNGDELKMYYAIADDYNHEIWHNLLSPTIYEDFLETVDVESQTLPKIISKLSQLDYEELKEIFILIQINKEEAKKKMKIYDII